MRNGLYRLGLVGCAAIGIAACEGSPVPGDNQTEMTRTAALAGAPGPNYDADVDLFLSDYVREDAAFADDDLDYDVERGVVTVRGIVDSEAERDALVRRLRRVPGVKDVNISQLRSVAR